MRLRSSSGGGIGDGWFHDNVTKMVGNGGTLFFGLIRGWEVLRCQFDSVACMT